MKSVFEVAKDLAKAALLRQSAVSLDWARTSHGAASRMLLVLRRQRNTFGSIGGAKVWEDVLWIVAVLEAAHPQLAPRQGPQLEYPWEDVHGNIRWPARDFQVAGALGDPTKNLAARVIRFAEQMGDHFDTMFA